MKGSILAITLLALSPLSPTQTAVAQTLSGLWDATLQINGVSTPFRLEISGTDDNVTATLFNGAERYPSTSGTFADGKLLVEWDYYASRIEADVRNEVMDGFYAGVRRMTGPYDFRAARHEALPVSSTTPPDIDGVWWMPTESGKGELSWRYVVQQDGTDLTAAILRIDGDTGAIEGTWQEDAFVISKFDGARAYYMEVSLNDDGSLRIIENGRNELVAYRPEVAPARGIPEPIDANNHTSMADANVPLQFNFPDLDGNMVANTDARFDGKVTIVEISGSWCPNCHDEAPFLGELYRKYRDQGLEIVTLTFEEEDQLEDPTRVRAFVRKHQMEFPVLLGGTTEEAPDKLPQLVNWNTWPATIFVGRNGLVQTIHAGFPSSGSGELYEAVKQEFEATVGRLLAE